VGRAQFQLSACDYYIAKLVTDVLAPSAAISIASISLWPN
jgi:hypothetical protein